MKKLLFIFITATALVCCSKDDNKSPIDQLPPATQTGENTAGCLVNGEALLPKGTSLGGPNLSCFYQQNQYGYHFGLSIIDKTGEHNKLVGISINETLVEGNTYILKLRESNGQYFTTNFSEYIIGLAPDYETTNIYTGEVRITKLDTQQKIIAGTFKFDALKNSDIVQIRDGRFDMHYVN